jgi:hypothetical protein
MELVYQIDSVNHADGTPFGSGLKEIPSEWKYQQYFLKHASVGRSAFLFYADDSGRYLQTSNIQGIVIADNTIILQTMNTVYYLRPVVKE